MTDKNGEPVHLIEDDETGDRFLVYGTDKGLRLDIRYKADMLWMTQGQIAELFGVDRTVITKHISNIYTEKELDPKSTSAKIAQVQQEGMRKVERQIEHYNLDTIISVGYRVSSAQATVFRRWATSVLVQFANIFDEGELSLEATVTKIETVRPEGNRQVKRTIDYYNLDLVISVGYRVSSAQATVFRHRIN